MGNDTQQFYNQFYVQNIHANTPYPNQDEANRVGAILPWLSGIMYQEKNQNRILLDVGCGRGWLTNILGIYGKTVGIEPVSSVIDYARELFPNIQFEAITPDEHLQAGAKHRYDIVVCSEVIEHISREDQESFLHTLGQLVKPGGDIILTTPRGELFDIWVIRSGGRDKLQPVENWLTEKQLLNLANTCQLKIVDHISFCDKTIPRAFIYWRIRGYWSAIMRRIGFKSYQTKAPIYQAIHLQTPRG